MLYSQLLPALKPSLFVSDKTHNDICIRVVAFQRWRSAQNRKGSPRLIFSIPLFISNYNDTDISMVEMIPAATKVNPSLQPVQLKLSELLRILLCVQIMPDLALALGSMSKEL